MTYRMMRQTCYSFFEVSRNVWNWAKKLTFRLIFISQDFAKLKNLYNIYLFVRFISIAFASVKLRIFVYFVFCIDSTSMKRSRFRGFGPYFSKHCLILWNFDNKTNSFWKILVKFEIWVKWNTPKVYSFGPFWDPIYCWKT